MAKKIKPDEAKKTYYCHFCRREVNEPHIIKCVNCGGQQHIGINVCACCGKTMKNKNVVDEYQSVPIQEDPILVDSLTEVPAPETEYASRAEQISG